MMSDLETLSADFPEWRFLQPWVGSNSGRMILASRKRDGLLVGGRTADEVSRKIIREMEAEGTRASDP